MRLSAFGTVTIRLLTVSTGTSSAASLVRIPLMTPLVVVLIVAAAVCAFCWIASLITHENSWVDRLWSIVPVAYVWIFAGYAGFADLRLNVMAGIVTLWGARLTFNFARKGGYKKGGEDYRWVELRKKLGPVGFQLFNATFIAPYQNALIFMLIAPMNSAALSTAPLGLADFALAAVFLLLLAGETIADQQQWDFYKAREARGGAAPKFLTTGLFKYSRHPNFFCEVSQWWVIYAFGIVASGQWLHWTIAGPALLTLLFDGSVRFTESISKSKYPEYAEYQKTTSRLLPMP